ncbi:proteasome subunit beta type-4 [Prorops nasuta]|uniref:proteasome subunit beta type-4 n=1 Tax=Prorops nasuta TaxID=863751 RepID=UPI0034CD18AE
MAMFNKFDSYSAPPFWHNGPTPGGVYNFPGGSSNTEIGGIQRSQAPVTTGTSVVGLHFKDGVIIAADTLASYGSLARYYNVERILKVNDNIMLGVTGDYADYQCVKSSIQKKINDEQCLDDGFTLKPKSLYSWLTRVMYNRRSSFDPFWNNFIIAGIDDGKPFLGTVDKLGTAYTDPVIATGYGSYIAVPLLRTAYDANKEMTKEEAIQVISKAMEVLFYRDGRAFPKYHIGIVTKEDGIEIRGPLKLETNWEAGVIGRE